MNRKLHRGAMNLPSHKEGELLSLLNTASFYGVVLQDRYRSKYYKVITSGTLYTTLKRMERKGWITLERGLPDGRLGRYMITRDGWNALERLRKHYTRI